MQLVRCSGFLLKIWCQISVWQRRLKTNNITNYHIPHYLSWNCKYRREALAWVKWEYWCGGGKWPSNLPATSFCSSNHTLAPLTLKPFHALHSWFFPLALENGRVLCRSGINCFTTQQHFQQGSDTIRINDLSLYQISWEQPHLCCENVVTETPMPDSIGTPMAAHLWSWLRR